MVKSKKNKKNAEKEKALEDLALRLKSSIKSKKEGESNLEESEKDSDLTNLDLKNLLNLYFFIAHD